MLRLVLRLALVLVLICMTAVYITPAWAGTDQGAESPDTVRTKIAESALRWATHPLGIPNSLCTADNTPHSCCTGAGVGVCAGVDDCTSNGTPDACCTGLDLGSCLPYDCGGGECCRDPATDQECIDYAQAIVNGLQAQSFQIELHTVGDASFVCNPYVPKGANAGKTFCRTFPATQTVVDSFVAKASSYNAATP